MRKRNQTQLYQLYFHIYLSLYASDSQNNSIQFGAYNEYKIGLLNILKLKMTVTVFFFIYFAIRERNQKNYIH